ncbi:DHA2 family efflux MFS transporter permease subunit [Kitasatospora sp. NBC_00374]|uniref:DHA2 family efflux MFS transporter permease subunit n=1 Tax=Kitasatospora sp. NBC_00374 TaxID=2975964 RepID=UPI0030E47F74
MSDTSQQAGGRPEVNPGLVLLLCSGATFMAFLDLSVVNIAFPEIIKAFPETTMANLTWVVSGYAVMFAALLTPAGRLADTVGRAKVFLGSLVGFTLASLLCGAAPSANWLIIGRFLQGAMAAGMIPAALGLIMAATPLPQLMKAIGAWSAAAGFSAVIGPVIGGLLVDHFSWRSVFYINGPIGLILLVAGLRALPRHLPPAGSRLPDPVGTVAFAVGVAFVVAALTEGDSWGWADARTLGLLVCGLALGLVALLRSQKHEAPAIDTGLWKSRRFARTNLVASIFGVSMFAWLLAGPLWATQIWGWSIMQAAGALSVGAVASMITSTVAGRISDGSKHRVLVVLGLLMFAACTAMQASALFGTEPRFWSAWVPSGILGGGGLGFAATALSSIAATSLPPVRFAAGVGMNLTSRQVGGAIGTAGLAAIMASYAKPGVDAFHAVYIACTVVSVVAAVVALTLPDPAPAPAQAQPQPQSAGSESHSTAGAAGA